MTRFRLGMLALGLALVMTSGGVPSPALAGPPSYLLLRKVETPPPHGPGKDGASYQNLPAQGYAYGYFGTNCRSHSQRSFGYYRTYTQWSWW